MNKRYCNSCGTPNSYLDGVAPKFCQKCGKALQFVVPEKSKGAASELNASKDSDDIEKKIDEMVRKKLAALLKNSGGSKRQSGSEEGEDEEGENSFDGLIPTPSENDVVVQVPKFMTLGELKNSDQPITRVAKKKFDDYTK